MQGEGAIRVSQSKVIEFGLDIVQHNGPCSIFNGLYIAAHGTSAIRRNRNIPPSKHFAAVLLSEVCKNGKSCTFRYTQYLL